MTAAEVSKAYLRMGSVELPLVGEVLLGDNSVPLTVSPSKGARLSWPGGLEGLVFFWGGGFLRNRGTMVTKSQD